MAVSPTKLQWKRGGPCVSKLWIACQIFLTQSRFPTLESATCVSRIPMPQFEDTAQGLHRLSDFLNAIAIE